MADVTANYSLELQGLMLEKAQLELNMQAQQYRIAQTQDEVTRIEVNIEATRTSVASLSEKITALKGS